MAKPLVSIVCTAYNHEKFIRDCLNGFLLQKTNFPYEILINEDASPDNTAAIIREYENKYPEIIKPIYQKENQYSKNVGIWHTILFPRARGKYLAICEGDDCWTDPFKLQKQVDFLETNPDYILTCGGYTSLNKGQMKPEILSGIVPSDQESAEGFTFTLKDATNAWIVKTLTCMFRNEKEIYQRVGIYKYRRDIHLVYHLLRNGKGYYFKESLGIYNMHEGGISSLKSDVDKYIKHYYIYREMYDENQDEYSRVLYLRMCFALINSRISLKLKDKSISMRTVFRDTFRLMRNRRELIPFLKALIPEQVKKWVGRSGKQQEDQNP